jgi:hypothetical protein
MSYYLFDLNDSKNEFNFDNLIIGRKIRLDDTISKYYIYYQESELEDPKEIYIKIPKLRLIYKLGNTKFNQENIPIYPNFDITNKFIKFIKDLENNIKSCFDDKLTNFEFVSLINKKNNLNLLKANIDDNLQISSDNLNIHNLTDFKINGQIEIILKLSYIWNKNNNKLGLSSYLYQIKYYSLPYELNLNFISTDKQIINQISYVKPEICITDKSPTENKDNVDIIKKKFVPSINDLQAALKNLKTKN